MLTLLTGLTLYMIGGTLILTVIGIPVGIPLFAAGSGSCSTRRGAVDR